MPDSRKMSDSGEQTVVGQPVLSRHRWVVGLILLAGTTLSVVFWYLTKEKSEHQFEADADVRLHVIERRLQNNLKLIHFLQAFYAGSEMVTKSEFDEFAKPLLEGYGDVEALGTVRHGELAPVFFVDRLKRPPEAIGFDAATASARESAMDGARRATRAIAVTGQIDLSGEDRSGSRMIVFGLIPEKPPSDKQPPPPITMLTGPPEFVMAVINVDKAVADVLEVHNSKRIDVTPFDKAVPRREPSGWYQDVPLDVAGAKWIIRGTPTDERDNWLPMIALLAGMSITALLALYVNVLLGRTAKVEHMVDRRAAQLKRANEKLEREISERKRVEQTLRESEAVYHSLVENLPLNLFRKDLDGKVEFGNLRYCETLGMSLGNLIGKTDGDLFPENLAVKYRQDDARVIDTGEVLEDIEEHRRPDGKMIYVQVLKAPVRNAAGEIVGVQGIFWDVTKRKEAEAALEQERYLLHALMDNLPHNIYFKDTASRFIRINRALAELFGVDDASEALGKTDSNFFTDEHAKQARADELEVMQTGRPLLDKEEKETWTDGSITWAVTTKLPLFDDEGRVTGTFGISRDITEKKRAAEALRAAKEAAETASRAKSDFLAHMSHEIRTPMNAVIGMTELVLDTELTASQREYLRMVRDSGESLLLVINDILDFSKIEAGRLELDCAPFALRETLGDTMKSLALRAHSKGLELACEIHSDVPDGLIGDLGRLRQIVVNLIGNAIKFTAEGEVVLDVKCDSQSDRQAVLHFAVRDTGIGVSQDKQKSIFDAFEQADRATTRRFGGTGLGLSITSRLVECMGGRIWVESELGQGSTFHFTAQFEPAPEVGPEMRPAQAIYLQKLKTLVVDDNATNRRILQEMLRNWDMDPTTVGGADEALDALRTAQADGEPFRLVLTDANMPDVDGFTLAKQIKLDAQLGSTVIMMLTSGDRPGDVSRCEQLGVAIYLLKPVKQSELFDAIVMAMGISVVDDEDAAAGGDKQPTWARSLRILLAEDSLVNQKLAVGLLERQGHSITVANNGKEAVAVAELEDFDVILMDVQMPEMDGLEATGLIRDKEKLRGRHTPIIAMTAHAMKGDRERCLKSGMDEYVPKPIRANRLFDTIKAVLGESAEADAQSDMPPPDIPLPDVPPPDTPRHETLPLSDSVDWQEAINTVKGDHELLREVVKAFLGEVPGLIEAIREAITAGDGAALRVAAHTLKGSVRYFGAAKAFDYAYELEKMGGDGGLGNAAGPFVSLEGEIAKLTPVLINYLSGGGAADR